jgi:hypothetical protein
MTEELSEGTWGRLGPTDRSMAIQSLREELQAIDDYDERIRFCESDSLRAALTHAREEECEHAAMFTEWIGRNDATFAEMMKRWSMTDRPFGKE